VRESGTSGACGRMSSVEVNTHRGQRGSRNRIQMELACCLKPCYFRQ
jgi:hypothetical protein